MKCPKCGCKMKKQIICPYCKITGDEVRFASNKEAKERIKIGDTSEVYISSYIPYDLSKKTLLLITIFGGVLGIDAYYVGRRKRGIIQVATFALAFISFLMYYAIHVGFFKHITEILTLVCAIFVCLWLSAIFRLCFGICKVPIVLPNEEQLKQRKENYKQELKEKEEVKLKKEAEKLEKKVNREKKNLEKKERKKKKVDNDK